MYDDFQLHFEMFNHLNYAYYQSVKEIQENSVLQIVRLICGI